MLLDDFTTYRLISSRISRQHKIIIIILMFVVAIVVVALATVVAVDIVTKSIWDARIATVLFFSPKVISIEYLYVYG